MQFVQGQTYYSVEMFDADDNYMAAAAIAPSSLITDDNIHQVCSTFIGLTSDVEGTVPGPVAKLVINRISDDTVPIPAPA